MADTPLDLASLPCSPATRWEMCEPNSRNSIVVLLIRVSDGKTVGSLLKDRRFSEWHVNVLEVTAETHWLLAAHTLLSALGLSPAPAADLDAQLAAMSDEARAAFAAKYGWDKAAPQGRTFTEPEVRRIAFNAAVVYCPTGDKPSARREIEEYVDALISEYTAAIAAATDAKENGQ